MLLSFWCCSHHFRKFYKRYLHLLMNVLSINDGNKIVWIRVSSVNDY